MISIRRWLTSLAVMLLEFERDDQRLDGRYRMRMARWLRAMKRKETTGRGTIRSSHKTPNTTTDSTP